MSASFEGFTGSSVVSGGDVLDMEGTIVAYAWAVAGSPFVPVPEPPSLPLMLTGSIWVAVFVKQRGRLLRTRRGGATVAASARGRP